MNTYQLFCVVSIKFNATAINCKQLLSDFTITIKTNRDIIILPFVRKNINALLFPLWPYTGQNCN